MKYNSDHPNVAIVHDHPIGWPGGGNVMLRRLFETYPGKKIHISSFAYNNSGDDHWVDAAYSMRKTANLGKYGLGRLRLMCSCLKNSKLSIDIAEILEKERIEVVHVVAHEFLWIPTLWASKSMKLGTVLAVHDYWPETVAKQLPRVISRLIYKQVANRANVILGAHSGMAALLKNEFGLKQEGSESDGLFESECINYENEVKC